MTRKVFPLERIRNRILVGDALTLLRKIPRESVNCCVTSPPYFGLRNYGVEGQIGLEDSPEEYVEKLVGVFREVHRVLKDEGTLWLNLGDSYAANRSYQVSSTKGGKKHGVGQAVDGKPPHVPLGLKPKDLLGIPWRVAFALQADGWYLRSDIIWHKPNPMPESVTDRPTKSHEYVFLLTKNMRYYYDAKAVAEPLAASSVVRLSQKNLPNQKGSDRVPGKTNGPMKVVGPRFGGSKYGDDPRKESATKSGNLWEPKSGMRNCRDVWSITTKPFKGAHFATFPPEIPQRSILAGCPVGGLVLDPFMGAGTTGVVAKRLGRDYIGIELNTNYAKMAKDRIDAVEEGKRANS